MKYGLLGEHLTHSFSAEIHRKLGRYSYELREISPEALPEFLTWRDFCGLNITIPYKETVIPYLDEITPRAASIGAVNTIVNRDGRLCGDNTDYGGMQLLVERMGLSLAGKKVLIAGTGGTSKTARALCHALGAGEVYCLSRSGREDAISYDAAREAHADADILFNTTPSGMFPKSDAAPVDLADFPALTGVVDVIYNPLTTRLVRQARARGIPAENGLYMLVAQAVLAAEQFTGADFGAETVERIYASLTFEKRSIVLIGMPGSGKSTLGEILARRLNRPLLDTDAEVVARAGAPVTEIFARQGEAAFRALETETVRTLGERGGAVIATGGGVPLRPENVDALRANGTLVFLDRALETLLPTDDRPLANSAEKIRALYTQRRPIYQAAADVTVEVSGTPEETAERILSALSAGE
ncbi:MAG: hypothetical protein LUG25_02515 [Oscillospiraceae bacterium]|nr:hypothetical protein [Oscillospiraceae bacterium]